MISSRVLASLYISPCLNGFHKGSTDLKTSNLKAETAGAYTVASHPFSMNSPSSRAHGDFQELSCHRVEKGSKKSSPGTRGSSQGYERFERVCRGLGQFSVSRRPQPSSCSWFYDLETSD